MWFNPLALYRRLFPKPYVPMTWEEYQRLEGFLGDRDWKNRPGGHNDSREAEGLERE